MDTRFSAAIHTLVLISEAETPMSSEAIAASVGTNPSYIRKLTAALKKGGIIESHRGVSGFALKKAPEAVTLLQIYLAVSEKAALHLFDLHQNPNDACIVGRHIAPVLSGMFAELEKQTAKMLAGKTLADCVARLRAQAEKEEENANAGSDIRA